MLRADDVARQRIATDLAEAVDDGVWFRGAQSRSAHLGILPKPAGCLGPPLVRFRMSQSGPARFSQLAGLRATEARRCFGNMPGDPPKDRDAPGA